MMWRILLPVVTCLVVNGNASDTPPQLFNRSMQNYDKNAAPNLDSPTEVKLGIYVNNFQFVGDKSSDFSVVGYLRQQWTDPRLTFPLSDGKTTSIRLPENSCNKIWLPDTFIRSSSSVKIADDLSSNRVLKLKPDGVVWYVVKISAVIPCRFDFRRYPFDKRRCELVFESFGYDMSAIRFSTLPHPVDIGSVPKMASFRLIDTSVTDCSQNYTTGAYTCLSIALTLKRNARPFILQFYLPCIIIVVLSWIAFWAEPHASSAARLWTGGLSLLALALLSALTGQSSFVGADATALDVWVLVCYVFVIATLLEHAVVCVLLKRRAGAGGLEFLRPPFVGAEKSIEANEKQGDEAAGGDGKRKARLVDWFSRISFPIAFLLFNLIYWIVITSEADDATAWDE